MQTKNCDRKLGGARGQGIWGHNFVCPCLKLIIIIVIVLCTCTIILLLCVQCERDRGLVVHGREQLSTWRSTSLEVCLNTASMSFVCCNSAVVLTTNIGNLNDIIVTSYSDAMSIKMCY